MNERAAQAPLQTFPAQSLPFSGFLARRDRAIGIDADIDGGQRAVTGAGEVGEAVIRVEDGAVRGAVELLLAALVVDGHAGVGTGPLAGDKVAVREVDEQAGLSIGWIGEIGRRVGGLVGIADDRAGMRWRLRRLRRRLRGGL